VVQGVALSSPEEEQGVQPDSLPLLLVLGGVGVQG
jgi:hypothetical protein